MPRYYEFEVALEGMQPRIWRRFLLRTTATFAHLQQALQDVFGWEGSHLWEFRLPGLQGRPIAGLPGDEDYGRPAPDARKLKLSTYFTGQDVVEWCEYLYDFGDEWVHEVKLVAVESYPESFKRLLLGGERSAPPEDCGGPPGYERLVDFLRTGEDPFGEDPEELRDWVGRWRPEAWDLGQAKTDFDR